MATKLWIANGATLLAFALALFGAAGTLEWPAAWAFLALFFGLSQALAIGIMRHDPAVLAERLKPPFQKGQPLWDKLLLLPLMIVWVGWLVLIGLDAVRYRWTVMPGWLQLAGGAGLLTGYWIIYRVFRVNTFLAAVVRIQSERGHSVVSSGPYAVVRHPMYAGAFILIPSIALMLGSWWGVVGSVPILAAITWRILMEERELRRGLPGYADYANRVRYRLVPFIW
jgi:protein-S-isoprenylcysteine O-methyltransferase Ste14